MMDDLIILFPVVSLMSFKANVRASEELSFLNSPSFARLIDLGSLYVPPSMSRLYEFSRQINAIKGFI